MQYNAPSNKNQYSFSYVEFFSMKHYCCLVRDVTALFQSGQRLYLQYNVPHSWSYVEPSCVQYSCHLLWDSAALPKSSQTFIVATQRPVKQEPASIVLIFLFSIAVAKIALVSQL